MFEAEQTVAGVSSALLENGGVASLVGLLVDEQFALQRVETCQQVVLFLFVFFALCLQVGRTLELLSQLLVALFVTCGFGEECGKLVDDEVVFVEHQAVDGE